MKSLNNNDNFAWHKNEAERDFKFITTSKNYITKPIVKYNLDWICNDNADPRFIGCHTVEDVKNKLQELLGSRGEVSEIEVKQREFENPNRFVFMLTSKKNSKYFIGSFKLFVPKTVGWIDSTLQVIATVGTAALSRMASAYDGILGLLGRRR